MLIIPVPARVFVMIFGAIAFLNSFQPGRGVADAAHLGGLVTGYLYLQSGRGGLTAEIKYGYLKWKMNRLPEEVRRLLRRPVGLGSERPLRASLGARRSALGARRSE